MLEKNIWSISLLKDLIIQPFYEKTRLVWLIKCQKCHVMNPEKKS